MLQEIYEKICAGEDLRANLIELKRQLKGTADGSADEKADGTDRAALFRGICGGNFDVIMKCLVDPDPKVRKNAADILGILKVQEAMDVLMDAYREEETRYIRPDYVEALAALDCSDCLAEFHRRLDELMAYDAPESEKKHVRAETTALRELLLAKEGFKKHTFTGYGRTHEVLLTTLPAFRDLLAADLPFRQIAEEDRSSGGIRKAPSPAENARPDGVTLSVSEMNIVLDCRYWQEMLFPLHADPELPADADRIAAALVHSDLRTILLEDHRGAPPFYFRLGVTGPLDREAKSLLAKRAGQRIEEVFEGELLNSASHYEAEIRLAADRGGGITPYLKLFTIPDDRFRYRRYHVAAGMRPFVAAGLIGLAKPYLKDHAQILDPFCGVGTLLIERCFAGPVRSAYGIDLFGEAVEKARRNTRIAGMPVHYINRDFFDFTHDYRFDEILTDLPDPVGDRAETDAFYSAFLEKSAGLLAERGRIFCYTAETGMLKKHLRLSGRFRLLAEFPILDRSGTGFLILERKNEKE